MADRGGRVQLATGVTWNRSGADIFIYGDEILALRNAAPELAAMIRALEAGTTRSTAAAIGGAKASETLRLLERLCYIVPEPTRRWRGTRLDRQVGWFSAMGFHARTAQERLCSARVAILGLGGIGSVVLQHLIAAGVRRFALIDADRVEASNLNRQPIYAPDQIGTLKIVAAAAHIGRHAPGADVVQHPCEVVDTEELIALMAASPGGWDCLVAAADRPADLIGRVVAPFCRRTGVPALGGACGLRTARWGPLITGEGLPGDAGPTEPDMPPPAPRAMAASFGPTNAIVADFLAKDVIILLAGGVPNCAGAVMVINFARTGIRAIQVTERADAG